MVIWQPAGGPAVLYAPEVCQALSNVPKRCCTSGVCGFWSYCYTSYVFLQVWLDQQWLTNLKMLKGFVEALLEFHFIWHCAGFWLSLLEEQSNDCSVWLTVPTDFLQIVPFFLQSPPM